MSTNDANVLHIGDISSIELQTNHTIDILLSGVLTIGSHVRNDDFHHLDQLCRKIIEQHSSAQKKYEFLKDEHEKRLDDFDRNHDENSRKKLDDCEEKLERAKEHLWRCEENVNRAKSIFNSQKQQMIAFYDLCTQYENKWREMRQRSKHFMEQIRYQLSNYKKNG